MSIKVTRMRPPEAARYLGVSVSTLAKWRISGDGPPYIKIGLRIVAYDQVDTDNWLYACRRRSTSDD